MESKSVPLVSVCMITYNHEPYIAEAIEGVLMQKTTFPIELIISEDCSTDGMRKIVEDYARKYPEIIVADLPNKNRGMIINARHNFSLTCGKYIALCEGDDYWTDPLKLQKQVNFLEANPEYGMCYTDLDSYNQHTGKIVRSLFANKVYKNNNTFERHLTAAGSLAPCTWVFKRDISSEIFADIKNDKATDGSFVLMLEIMLRTKVYLMPDVTAVYRINEGSASRQKDKNKRYLYHKGIFDIQKQYIQQIQNKILIRDFYLRRYGNLMYVAIKNIDFELFKESVCYLSNDKYGYSPLKLLRQYHYAKTVGSVMIRLIIKKIFR